MFVLYTGSEGSLNTKKQKTVVSIKAFLLTTGYSFFILQARESRSARPGANKSR
jgi:hypothetical protein